MGQLIVIEKWAENLEEVTLNRWLRAEGERVAPGDVLCEIITDKVTFEYEVDVGGVLRRVYCPEKSVLPIGFAIAFIGEAEEPLPQGIEERNRRLLEEHEAKAALHLDLETGVAFDWGPRPRAATDDGRPVRATPAARRAARELGVSIEAVAAWLAEDRPVTETDVQAYVRAGK